MGGLFSAPSTPSVAPAPVVEAAPTEQEQEPETAAVRDEETRKIKARRSMSGTVLTSPLGTTGAVNSLGSSLLGQSGM